MNYRFDMLPGEHWWGGSAAIHSAALDAKSEYHIDLRKDGRCLGNQAAPLFLSDHGRAIWSADPFSVDMSRGVMTFEGNDITLTKAGETLRDAFLYAMHAHYPCDGRKLEDVFFQKPQYNTWMEFTYYPTQESVLAYARKWVEYGFAPGILTIDEGWENDYGDWKFHPARFPDPAAMVNELHDLGFRVMLWIVPYISPNGEHFNRSLRPLVGTDPEMAKHLYMRTTDGEIAIYKWWNGYSALLDLTNPWDERFLTLQLDRLMDDYQIDGFKFDGGSVAAYMPSRVVNGTPDTEHTPQQLNAAWNAFGRKYVYHEYKDSFAVGGYNAIQRLRDKFHTWDQNGLDMLIPGAITAGLLGFPFLCPDMIGGGEWTYRFKPDFQPEGELFIRMAQCSAMFPMMQFSWALWNVLNAEEMSICLKAAKLHDSISEEILQLVRTSEQSGEPILCPIEYYAPHEGFADITDEFMLGRDILVAPVITKGARERNVSFPSGVWKDEEGHLYQGGRTYMLPAPLDTLLWFRRTE